MSEGTVTLYGGVGHSAFLARMHAVPIEMPSATSGGYAAMRVAEALGYDPGVGGWKLASFREGHLADIDSEAPVAELDGQMVFLGRERV